MTTTKLTAADTLNVTANTMLTAAGTLIVIHCCRHELLQLITIEVTTLHTRR
jgi:hypothetical protein